MTPTLCKNVSEATPADRSGEKVLVFFVQNLGGETFSGQDSGSFWHQTKRSNKQRQILAVPACASEPTSRFEEVIVPAMVVPMMIVQTSL